MRCCHREVAAGVLGGTRSVLGFGLFNFKDTTVRLALELMRLFSYRLWRSSRTGIWQPSIMATIGWAYIVELKTTCDGQLRLTTLARFPVPVHLRPRVSSVATPREGILANETRNS